MLALKNILVATDFGEASDVALTYGRELATRFDATLHVLHVADDAYLPPRARSFSPPSRKRTIVGRK